MLFNNQLGYKLGRICINVCVVHCHYNIADHRHPWTAYALKKWLCFRFVWPKKYGEEKITFFRLYYFESSAFKKIKQ